MPSYVSQVGNTVKIVSRLAVAKASSWFGVGGNHKKSAAVDPIKAFLAAKKAQADAAAATATEAPTTIPAHPMAATRRLPKTIKDRSGKERTIYPDKVVSGICTDVPHYHGVVPTNPCPFAQKIEKLLLTTDPAPPSIVMEEVVSNLARIQVCLNVINAKFAPSSHLSPHGGLADGGNALRRDKVHYASMAELYPLKEATSVDSIIPASDAELSDDQCLLAPAMPTRDPARAVMLFRRDADGAMSGSISDPRSSTTDLRALYCNVGQACQLIAGAIGKSVVAIPSGTNLRAYHMQAHLRNMSTVLASIMTTLRLMVEYMDESSSSTTHVEIQRYKRLLKESDATLTQLVGEIRGIIADHNLAKQHESKLFGYVLTTYDESNAHDIVAHWPGRVSMPGTICRAEPAPWEQPPTVRMDVESPIAAFSTDSGVLYQYEAMYKKFMPLLLGAI
jgi:hypothetical protein